MQASNSSFHRSVSSPMFAALAVGILAAAVLALGFAPSDAGAKASFGGTLSGSTSQGNPWRIRISGDGRMLREASVTIAVQCPAGSVLLPQKVRGLSIARGGRFAGTLEDTATEEGLTINLFESFSGKFNSDRTKVVAKSRIHLNLQAPDGTSETCDSGVVTLRASR